MESLFEHPSSEYIFRLEDFEGPIELLVQLARSNGLDIYTLKISEITDQYLAIVDSIDTKDLDSASDFLLMAATLLEIKARALIPVEQEDYFDDEDYYDPEDEIRRLMIEYEIFQEKAKEMKESETIYRFYREPVYDEKDVRITIKGFNLDKLMEAYAKVIFEFNKEEEFSEVKTIDRDTYTVEHQLTVLVDRLIAEREVSFFSIFGEAINKFEIINTFLALLQLVSKQFAKMVQETPLGDIIIGINEECDPDTYNYGILAMASKEDNFDAKSDANT